MSASNCPRLALPKPTPKLLEKRAKVADLKKRDRTELQKCHERSGRQCEVYLQNQLDGWLGPEGAWVRCFRRATENHHLKGGRGRRNVGDSVLARHRADVCAEHHRELTAHILEPVSDVVTKARGLRVERVR